MAKLTLAPEEDDSDFSLLQKSGSGSPTKFERLHPHFNPKKVGFGIISSLPDVEPTLEGDGIRLTDKSQNEKEQR